MKIAIIDLNRGSVYPLGNFSEDSLIIDIKKEIQRRFGVLVPYLAYNERIQDDNVRIGGLTTIGVLNFECFMNR